MTGTELILPNGDVIPVRDRRALSAERRDPRGATQKLTYTSPGMPQIDEWDARSAWKLGVQANVIAYRCVRLRAIAGGSVPIVAGRRQGDASTINENAPIVRLLGPPPGGPAPKLSATRLLRWTFAQKIVTGRRAWEIEFGANDRPVAFWPLPASELRAVPSERGVEWFREFRFGRPVEPVTYRPREVFYGWEPAGTDFRQAESELQSLRFDLSLVSLCDAHSISFLRNSAVPAAVITTTKFPTDDARRRFLNNWASEFGGVDNVGRVALNELDDEGDGPVADSIDVKVLGLSAKDSRLVEMRTEAAKEIAIGLGVPFSKLDASGRTFDNAGAEDLDFWENTVLPDLIDLQDDINMQLAPLLGDDVVWFDLRQVRALQRRIQPITQTVGAPSLVQAQLMTINEARADYGLGPTADGDRFMTAEEIAALAGGGSDEVVRVALVAIEERTLALEARNTEPPAPEPPPGPERTNEPPALEERTNEPPALEERVTDPEAIEARRSRIWRSTDASVRVLEQRWERAMGRLFARQLDATLARLTGKRGRQTVDRRAAEAGSVFDPEFWANETAEVTTDLYEQVVAASTAALAAGFDVSFDLGAPWVEDFVRARANQLAGNITQTTYEAIQEQLVEGVDAGEGVDELADRIRTLFRQTYANRAETVARTEVISAYNGAAAAGAATLPADVVAAQEWIATRDGRTRDAHASADGQVVAIGEAFSVGGRAMAYPGDPSGGAGNVVNCRCTVAFLTPEEAAEALARSAPVIDHRAAAVALRFVARGDFDEIRFRRTLEACAA